MIHCSFFAQRLKITILLQTNFLFKVQRALAFLNQRTERERRGNLKATKRTFSTLTGIWIKVKAWTAFKGSGGERGPDIFDKHGSGQNDLVGGTNNSWKNVKFLPITPSSASSRCIRRLAFLERNFTLVKKGNQLTFLPQNEHPVRHLGRSCHNI